METQNCTLEVKRKIPSNRKSIIIKMSDMFENPKLPPVVP